MRGHSAPWIVIVLMAGAAHAQDATVGPLAAVVAPLPPEAPCCVLAAGTPIEVELTELVTSRTAKEGQHFGIKLASDVQVGGRTLLAGESSGYGEVIDAARAGLMGRPGKLILVARALDVGRVHLRLRGFSLPAEGDDASKPVSTISTAARLADVPAIGIVAMAITGGDVEYPAGTWAMAKLAADAAIIGPDTTSKSEKGSSKESIP